VRAPAESLDAGDALQRVGNQMAQGWEKPAGADGQPILERYRGK
jgi:hypothetical protein